jgi:hypothetical protein
MGEGARRGPAPDGSQSDGIGARITNDFSTGIVFFALRDPNAASNKAH